MKKNYIILIIGVLAILSFGIFNQKDEPRIVTPNEKYKVLVADNDQERIKGLSDMEKLSKDTVMLFVFEKSDYHGIWMKDMLIDIDIVYLDEDYTVINYFDEVSPTSYPAIYYPERPAKYVLEMPAGERKKSGIAKNTKVYYK